MKTLLIDWSNLQYRCLFTAFKEDPFDEEFKLYRRLMFSTLLEYAKQFEPDEIVVCGDGRNPWRRKFYPEYKQKRNDDREKSPVDFEKFFPIADGFWKDLSSTFGTIRFVKIDDVEADDIVASIVERFPERKFVAVSTDKDYVQLLKNENFSIWNPIKKDYVVSLNPVMDLAVKIVCGDKSDNISGVRKGVGEKKAEKMIRENRLDVFLAEEPGLLETYNRNRKLIDMGEIPSWVKEKANAEYDRVVAEGKTDVGALFSFAKKHVPDRLAEMSSIRNLFENLNGEEHEDPVAPAVGLGAFVEEPGPRGE